MKLFWKVLLSFSIVILLFVALSIYSMTQSSKLKDSSQTLYTNGVEPSIELIEIANLTENTRVQMLTALAFQNKEATAFALADLDEIQALQTAFDKTILTEQLQQDFNQFKEKWLLFDERVRTNHQLIQSSRWAEAEEGLKLGKPLFEDAKAAFDEALVSHTVELQQVQQSTEDVYQHILTVSIILIIVTTIVALVISYMFSRQMIQRLTLAVDRAALIAQGDLTAAPLQIKGADEITTLAAGLNEMQLAITRVVSEATDSSQQVSASAEELSATTNETMGAAESIAELAQSSVENATTQLTNLTDIANSFADMNHNVQSIAERVTQLGQLSQATLQQTEIGSHAVKAVNEQIHSIAESSQITETSVNSLDKKSQEIGDIINIITSIADQTNLLALNAAIEAARAGEAGKGFAVVADEVRHLAEESRLSAEKIQMMVSEIQGDIQTVITSIHEETNRVNDGLAKSEQVTLVFNELAQMVTTVRHNSSDIDESIHAISQISTSILEHTTEIQRLAQLALTNAESSNRSTEIQLGSTEEISAATESLTNLAEQLQAVINHFKL
ncbi:methyl-accepting chemotaxis protein [Metasolibacillus sp.]|uniref:methyl-accepting chemotaxis protein n=1 Tax=Metasolibacillus sp. TaxID=2703680 RepID=UPI0025FBA08A|nr:methyl-accepting chemotaxis protein [Metasolibacillus sp.]MCT6922851.1 methyl-accepting chemotaxis protein [Metasolibacillus sp.]MCT6938810.1 methyl-accepting chemotaxis protein [Metasolibacillus sp.]